MAQSISVYMLLPCTTNGKTSTFYKDKCEVVASAVIEFHKIIKVAPVLNGLSRRSIFLN